MDENLPYYDDYTPNLKWGMSFIFEYDIFYAAKYDPNFPLLRIKPMFDDSNKVIGFMFSFHNDQITTARPTNIYQKYCDFKLDFKTNYFDHKHIADKFRVTPNAL